MFQCHVSFEVKIRPTTLDIHCPIKTRYSPNVDSMLGQRRELNQHWVNGSYLEIVLFQVFIYKHDKVVVMIHYPCHS